MPAAPPGGTTLLGYAGDVAKQRGATFAAAQQTQEAERKKTEAELAADREAQRRQTEALQAQLAGLRPTTAPTITQPYIAAPSPVQAAGAPTVAQALAPYVPEAARVTAAYAPGVSAVGGAQVAPAAQIGAVPQVTGAYVAAPRGFEAARVGAPMQVTPGVVQGATVGGPQGDLRTQQLALIGQIQRQLAGEGQSVAELQFQRQQQQLLGQQLGIAAGARGTNIAAARRGAAANIAQMGGEASLAAGMLRAQEQERARGQALGALEATRGADISVALEQARLQQQAGITGAQLGQEAQIANQRAMLQAQLAQAGYSQEAARVGAEQMLQRNLAMAGFQQQAGLASAQMGLAARTTDVEALNRAAAQQAGLTQQANLANLDVATRTMLQNAAFQQQAGITNAEAQNRQAQLVAQLQAQFGLSNVDAQNRATQLQAQFQQQAGMLTATQGFDHQKALADLGFRTQQVNLQAGLTQQQINQQQQAQLMNMLLQSQGLTLRAGESEADRVLRERALQVQMQQIQAQQSGQWLGALGTLGAAAIASDVRQKQAVAPARGEIGKLLDSLRPYSYEYRDTEVPGTAPGRRYGVMAQDLERSPAGQSVVRDTEHGKVVDVPQSTGLLFAALSEMHRRLKKVEHHA